jgi:hypothetical protein
MQGFAGKGTSDGMGLAAKSVRFEVCFAKPAENIFLNGKEPYLSIAALRRVRLFPFWNTYVKVVELGALVGW